MGRRRRTLEERGLDFADVASADWANALTQEDIRAQYPETRYVTEAPIHGRLCFVAWCRCGSAMRIISLRKANDRERKRYAKALDLP